MSRRMTRQFVGVTSIAARLIAAGYPRFLSKAVRLQLADAEIVRWIRMDETQSAAHADIAAAFIAVARKLLRILDAIVWDQTE